MSLLSKKNFYSVRISGCALFLREKHNSPVTIPHYWVYLTHNLFGSGMSKHIILLILTISDKIGDIVQFNSLYSIRFNYN